MDLPELIALETSVWEALREGSGTADARLLSADFLGVYPTGFAGRDDHVGQLDDGPTVAEYAILEPRLLVLSKDHVVLAYRAEYCRPRSAEIESMYVSSVWSRRDGAWINVFSQDTPVDPETHLP